MTAEHSCVVAMDVGGTSIKGAVLRPDGTTALAHRRPTGAGRGGDATVEGILSFAAELMTKASARIGVRPSAVGVAVPGVVDEATGTAVYAANLDLRHVPLARLLADRLGLPAAVGHDVRAGGLAEARLGAGRGSDCFLFLPIGTGIAGALVRDGRAYAGSHSRAVEIGHVVVRPVGPRCGCGAYGCLEAVASAAAIARSYTRTAREPSATAADVGERAAAGDKIAARIWSDAVTALADGVTICVTLLDPERIAVGGGLARAGERLLRPLREAVAGRLTFQVMPDIVAAGLGDEAGCLGAGLLAWDLVDEEDET
ncbi:MAG: ROK family protein [Nocardioidaceae bacterium]